MKRFAILTTLALAACNQQPEGEPVVRAELGEAVAGEELAAIEQAIPDIVADNPDSPCRLAVFETVSLTHCIADPELHTLRASLAPSSGENFGTIEAWAAGRNESAIAFVMNAGMYGDDLRPIGYFVEDSDRLVELNRADGDGNFFMKPNGVFFGTGGVWRILEADTFLRTIGTRPQFGTQSGPMLVLNGNLHPEFQDNGPSRTIRNGVGIDAKGRAHFVIANEPVSFGQFARFFRDELETPNALYLDGAISALWDPANGRMDSGRVGPLLVVEKK
ncbi:MAG: phosphodiester glycosidase family protein [Erythrobacter sp.]